MKEKIVIGGSIVAVIVFLFPPVVRIGGGRRTWTEWAPIWDLGTSSIDVPLLLTELLIAGVVSFALFYAFGNRSTFGVGIARTTVFVIVQTIRFLSVPIAIWQVLGLLPVLSWLNSLEAVTPGMWAMAAIKGVILAICLGLFYGLRSLSDRLKIDESKADKGTA